MELITNNNELTIKSFSNNTKLKSKSPLKYNKELNLNNSLHNNIKKLSTNRKYNKLKKKKTLDKFFEKYISEKLNVPKDKVRKNNTVEKSIDTKIFYNSSDKSGFYRKAKAKITKIIKSKKIVTDSFFKINKNNFSEHLRIQDNKLITNSPVNKPTLNKNTRYPLKTINISELKSFEENQETNCTFLNHTNSNFNKNNNKQNIKIKDIKL